MLTPIIEETEMASSYKKRAGAKKMNVERTKVSFWLSNQVLKLVDQVAESYGISRSDYIRLTLRETLVNRGLLPRETGSPLSTKQGV